MEENEESMDVDEDEEQQQQQPEEPPTYDDLIDDPVFLKFLQDRELENFEPGKNETPEWVKKEFPEIHYSSLELDYKFIRRTRKLLDNYSEKWRRENALLALKSAIVGQQDIETSYPFWTMYSEKSPIPEWKKFANILIPRFQRKDAHDAEMRMSDAVSMDEGETSHDSDA